MNSPLKQNITSLQNLLEQVNALPEAGGVELPELQNEGFASDLMLNKELIDGDGNVITGTFTIENELTTQDDLISQIQIALQNKASASEPVLQDKIIDPSTNSQVVVADSGYDGLSQVTVNAIPTATQATPSISVNSNGLITASVEQASGYVTAGTKSATKQLTTQAAKTITPSTSSQTAVAKDVYTTGVVTVGAIPSNYIIPSGTLNITTNDTYDVKSYASVNVDVPTGGGSGGDSILTQLLEGTTFANNDITEINVDLFRGWQYITKLSLPNVTKTVSTGYLCYGCTKLEEVYMPKCTNLGNYAFYNNTALKYIDFPSLTAAPQNGFRQCTSATSVNLPICKTLNSYAFQKCTAIEKLNFPMVDWLGAQVFNGCSALTALIFRVDKVCTMSNANNIFASTPIASGTGYIYVPSTLVDSYKSATNWSQYAAQIRAIEDYPDICGT